MKGYRDSKTYIKKITRTDELHGLIDVRNESYLQNHKTPPSSDEDLSNLVNPEYQILVMHNEANEIIGSVAINICSEKFRWIPNQENLPQPKECIEVSKFFFLAKHRNLKNIVAIFQQVHKYLRASGRSYILCCSDSKLERMYARMDFKSTGIKLHKIQQGKVAPLNVLIACHKQFGIYGLLNGYVNWNLYMKPIIDELKLSNIKVSFGERLLYSWYSYLGNNSQNILLRKLR